MKDQPQRDTYLSGEQIMARVDDYLAKVQHTLKQRAQHGGDGERVAMLLAVLSEQQSELRGGVSRFCADAPPAFMATYSQYTLELPDDLQPLPEPLDSDALVRWLLDANESLLRFFKELAEKAENPHLGEAFVGLEAQMRGHDQRIAQEANRFRDL